MRVYLDTNFFIRFVESDDASGIFLIENAAAAEWSLVTSALTLAEVLVAPLKSGNLQLAKTYEELLTSDDLLTVTAVDTDVLRESARIRATIGNKTADAIHVATAVRHGCSVFVSSDGRIRLPASLPRIAVEDVANLDIWP